VKWENMQEPIIKVSDDGTMAFAMVKKLVHYEYLAPDSIKKESITEFAWLETWAKEKGKWKMQAIASTKKNN
jgi:hypothetical protein